MLLNFLINLSLFRMSYAALAAFAQTIHDGYVALAADYPAPNPAVAAFQADIDKLNTALAKWGVKGNHGSHIDHLALIVAATVVRNDLRTLSIYAQDTKPEDSDSWAELGFKIKRPKSKPKLLEMVQNFRHFLSRAVPSPNIKLRWKRPLDTAQGEVKGYIIQRNNTAVYPLGPDGSRGIANVIGYVPNTAFIDVNPLVGENFYWVTPFNSVGLGVTSAAVMVVSSKTSPV
jgi:hypothetical protein